MTAAARLLALPVLLLPLAAGLGLLARGGWARLAAPVLAAALAAAATLIGLAVSFLADWPTNPTICAAACALLLLALPAAFLRGR